MVITVDDFLPFDLLRREAGQDVVADQALPVLRVFVTLHLSALVVFALDVAGSHRTLDLHPADGRHTERVTHPHDRHCDITGTTGRHGSSEPTGPNRQPLLQFYLDMQTSINTNKYLCALKKLHC